MNDRPATFQLGSSRVGSVLVANRGEIACRVIRTARRMGLATIAVYSDADVDARHVRLADEAYAIGPAEPRASYLSIGNILEAAKTAKVRFIHPGYGFLSENAEFADACQAEGFVFVGPPSSVIRLMGEKDQAKALMMGAGVTTLPGASLAGAGDDAISAMAEEIGYPLLLKAVAGGGGRGIRRVEGEEDLASALRDAEREAQSAFGDGRLMMEKWLERPRHIEVQVFADRQGRVVHLYERDCSLQRRHQKVIEESPAPHMPEGLRQRLCDAAVKAAQAVGYEGAGTVEFLTETSALSDDTVFYFLEMNTRLQVEHPVTEMVTGLDLVEWQLRVAAGEPLPLKQDEIAIDGHAIEARLYAEDVAKDFIPSGGSLHALRFPSSDCVRVETGFDEGQTVPSYYDAMLAKLIAYGRSREKAMERLKAALRETVVAGPVTNQGFLLKLLGDAQVCSGKIDTGLIARAGKGLLPEPSGRAVLGHGAAALEKKRARQIDERRKAFSSEAVSPWSAADGFQLGGERLVREGVLVDGEKVEVLFSWGQEGLTVRLEDDEGRQVESRSKKPLHVVDAGEGMIVVSAFVQSEFYFPDLADPSLGDEQAKGLVRAPMHGRIAELSVSEGDVVAKGGRLGVLEAMKMEHVLSAPFDGRVVMLSAEEGEQVEEGCVLITIESGEPGECEA